MRKISSILLSVIFLAALFLAVMVKETADDEDCSRIALAATSLTEPTKADLLQTEIENELRQQSFKGTALIIRDRQLLYQASFGYADVKKKLLNAENVAYPIASLEKVITGVMIQQLVSEKLVTYDTTVAAFYPELKENPPITLRQLLDQTSGIRMTESTPDHLLTTEKEQLGYTLTELTSGNQQEFSYTNANYTLLAGIISRLTGKSYEENLQERIIRPLHLNHTWSWDQLPENAVKPQAYLHEKGKDYQPDPFENSDRLFSSLLGAGNLYMTATDMWRLQQGMTDGRLLTETQYRQLADIDSEEYSGGLWHTAGRKVIHGSLGGFDTAVYGDETNETLVILFGNQAPADGADTLAETLFDLVSRH